MRNALNEIGFLMLEAAIGVVWVGVLFLLFCAVILAVNGVIKW